LLVKPGNSNREGGLGKAMANLFAIHSVGSSLITYLRNSYPEPLRTDYPCDFRLLSSGEMADLGDMGTAVSLYLYRITVNEHLRTAPMTYKPQDRALPLSVDLHYLLSVWADSALVEHTLIAWVMSELDQHCVLDKATLSSDGGWFAEDQIQIVPVELSNEDLMRIWDALAPNYRLSVSYKARVVRIDPQPIPTGKPVVAKRLGFSDEVQAAEEADSVSA
jgi:hypothetical protein